MKRLLAVFGLATLLILTTGCGSEEDKQRAHEIRMAKIESGQALVEEEMDHERRMAYSVPRPTAPIAMGTYIDYRGNPAYGHWDIFGNWVWSNPNGMYATQTRHYLDYQVATGVLGAGVLAMALTRDSWDRDHRDGWKSRPVVVKNYISSDGKQISKKEYKKRQATAQKKRDTWKKNKSTYQAKNKSTYSKTTTTTTKTTTTATPPAKKKVALQRSTKQADNKVSSKSHVNRKLSSNTNTAKKKPLLTRKTTQKQNTYKKPAQSTYKKQNSYKKSSSSSRSSSSRSSSSRSSSSKSSSRKR
jgi:hypothetical protein